MLWRPSIQTQSTNLFNALLLFKHSYIRILKVGVFVLYANPDIQTLFVYVCEYSMCVSRIVIAIKCNEFVTKNLKKMFCKTFRF